MSTVIRGSIIAVAFAVVVPGHADQVPTQGQYVHMDPYGPAEYGTLPQDNYFAAHDTISFLTGHWHWELEFLNPDTANNRTYPLIFSTDYRWSVPDVVLAAGVLQLAPGESKRFDLIVRDAEMQWPSSGLWETGDFHFDVYTDGTQPAEARLGVSVTEAGASQGTLPTGWTPGSVSDVMGMPHYRFHIVPEPGSAFLALLLVGARLNRRVRSRTVAAATT